jgi:hypothetical protein
MEKKKGDIIMILVEVAQMQAYLLKLKIVEFYCM